MTGRTSLTVRQNVSQLTVRDGPHLCTVVLQPLAKAWSTANDGSQLAAVRLFYLGILGP